MFRATTILAALGALLWVAVAPPGAQADAPPPFNAVAAHKVLDLGNAERLKAGLPPLSEDARLDQAAGAYAVVLATADCFGHTCGAAPEMANRIEGAGYTTWTAIGENIAAGYPTPEAVTAGWLASPGHRANLLNARYTDIGIAEVSGAGPYKTYWVQEFGSQVPPQALPASSATDGAGQEGGDQS